MYPGYILLFVLAYHVGPGLSLPSATYDQRQTGDVNVQVHVKDVQVLALLGSDMLDDYTVKRRLTGAMLVQGSYMA